MLYKIQSQEKLAVKLNKTSMESPLWSKFKDWKKEKAFYIGQIYWKYVVEIETFQKTNFKIVSH